MMTARSSIPVVALVVLMALAAAPSEAARCRGKHWLAVWSTSPSGLSTDAFVDQSLRLIVNPTYGGSKIRVRLSNRFGSQPARFGAVTIAQRRVDGSIVAGTARRLRFGKRRSVTIPPGGEVVSDVRRFPVAAFQDVVVSLHVVTSGRATEHWAASQTSYATAPGSGDHTGDETGIAYKQEISTWPFLTDIEVRAGRRVAGLVTVGDSITDGLASPSGTNQRYPDFLARRLASPGSARIAVQNAGISGNRILTDDDAFGPSLLDRLDRDAVDQAGASIALVMEGTNDLGLSPPRTAAEVIAGLETVVQRLHDAGFRVILGTQPPAKGAFVFAHGTPTAIADRNAINAWILTSGIADGVVDFAAAVRDPSDPDALRADFDSGDHLHPSAAGYEAMANAVDTGLLVDPPCR